MYGLTVAIQKHLSVVNGFDLCVWVTYKYTVRDDYNNVYEVQVAGTNV